MQPNSIDSVSQSVGCAVLIGVHCKATKLKDALLVPTCARWWRADQYDLTQSKQTESVTVVTVKYSVFAIWGVGVESAGVWFAKYSHRYRLDVCLLLLYVLVPRKVISGPEPTYNSVRS